MQARGHVKDPMEVFLSGMRGFSLMKTLCGCGWDICIMSEDNVSHFEGYVVGILDGVFSCSLMMALCKVGGKCTSWDLLDLL